MEKKKVNLEMVKVIQDKISDDLCSLALAMWSAEESDWKFALEYTKCDVMNAVNIFGHVLDQYGSTHDIITAKNHQALEKKLRALVKEMTGLTPTNDEAQ